MDTDRDCDRLIVAEGAYIVVIDFSWKSSSPSSSSSFSFTGRVCRWDVLRAWNSCDTVIDLYSESVTNDSAGGAVTDNGLLEAVVAEDILLRVDLDLPPPPPPP